VPSAVNSTVPIAIGSGDAAFLGYIFLP